MSLRDAASPLDRPSRDRQGATLALLAFAMLIVSLDQYIVVVALPEIGRELGYSAQTLQSVISAYAVASAGFLLLGGRAADLLGRRRVFVAGLSLYAAASLGGGLASEPDLLLVARAVQGLGGALLFPGHSVTRQHQVRRGAGAQPRGRGLGRRRCGRPRHRRAAGRRPHTRARLAGGLLRQRAPGGPGDPARVRADPHRQPPRGSAAVRSTRRAHRHRRDHPARVRPRGGSAARLGLPRDRGRRGRERSLRSVPSRSSSSAAATRSCRPGCSPTATSPRPLRSHSFSGRRSGRCSTS